MPTVLKIRNAPVNPDRLREECAAAGLGSVLDGRVRWAGFSGSGNVQTPLAAATVVGITVVNGSRVFDTAQPGEIRLELTRDFTGNEESTLDATLAAHNAATLSGAQQRAAEDEAALDALIATDYPQVVSDLQLLNGTPTQAQRNIATTRILASYGKAVKILIRMKRDVAL